jgi:hypothetical protein
MVHSRNRTNYSTTHITSVFLFHAPPFCSIPFPFVGSSGLQGMLCFIPARSCNIMASLETVPPLANHPRVTFDADIMRHHSRRTHISSIHMGRPSPHMRHTWPRPRHELAAYICFCEVWQIGESFYVCPSAMSLSLRVPVVDETVKKHCFCVSVHARLHSSHQAVDTLHSRLHHLRTATFSLVHTSLY